MANPLEQLSVALADRYEIEREIGAGGMATVYLARDIRHKREVALKVLKPELGAVLGTERFLSEITVTANLQHPNLLPLFDSGEAAGLLFYVMPFVRGETLRAKIDRERQLSVDETVRMASAILSALQYAHEHGVIHRDLKPENILIHSGQPVIADFGIALAVSNAGGARVTQTGLSLGTPQYMSPEQATGDRVIDARSDIYSFGAVIYEMLSGEPPHSGSTAQAIIAKLMTSEPQPLNTLRSTIPNNVVCAVEKALAKLPADRFASAQEFASALQNPSFTIASKSGQASVTQAVAVRKWRFAALGAGLAVVALLGFQVWTAVQPAPVKQVVRYQLGLDTAETPAGGLSLIALSRDGRRLVYSVRSSGVLGATAGPYLMVRDRDQFEARMIPGVEEAFAPFISDDGTQVGYSSPPKFLRVVSLAGGPPILISDSAGGGGSFGPDGSIYTTSTSGKGIIRLESSAGSIPTHLTRVDSAHGEIYHTWPEILPGGKAMLFTIVYRSTRSPAVAVADLASGKYQAVTNGIHAKYVAPGRILYVTSDGTLMTTRFDLKALQTVGKPSAVANGLRVSPGLTSVDFTVTESGTLAYVTGSVTGDREAVWISRQGVVTRVDSTLKGNLNHPTLSPDGKRVAIEVRSKDGSDIWIKQLDAGPMTKLTFDGPTNANPSWSPDGTKVTFNSNTSGTFQLWTQRADGSAKAVLQATDKKDLGAGIWSADGKWLVVRTYSSSDGAGDILAMRPGVDSVATPLVATKFIEGHPSLSPDGKWLTYSSTETGRSEVYVVPFPDVASGRWAISANGGSEPVWAHSGREIFFRTNTEMFAVPVQLKPVFSSGIVKPLFVAGAYITGSSTRQYDVAPDDSRFLFLRFLSSFSSNKIFFVDNWAEEFKNK